MSRSQPSLLRRRGPFVGSLVLILGLWLLGPGSAPSWGYIVVLKDGSQITTKEKYRIEGDKAILILPSGVQAFYDASDIDIDRTDRLNVTNYGTARLIEGQRTTQLSTEVRLDDRTTLRDLVGSRSGLTLPPPTRRPTPGQDSLDTSEGSVPLTPAGFVDLTSLTKRPHPNAEVTTEVMGYLKGQGIEEVRIYQGSQSDHALLEIVTASEASVFKAIKDSANGLVQINQRFSEVAAFELLLLTDTGVRAGQFVITPELANLLVTDAVDLPTFYLRYVEF